MFITLIEGVPMVSGATQSEPTSEKANGRKVARDLSIDVGP